MENNAAANSVPPLTSKLRFIFSSGHVFNDLCASMWLTYLILYFHRVQRFSNSLAGVLLLIGQIADGLITPFVGLELDKVDTFMICQKYGRKKSFHFVGTICVLVSFPFVFIQCLGCDSSSKWAQLIYYSGFTIIFQVGWAAVQVSHLSLVSDLTSDSQERTSLLSWRYSSTVISNIIVYCVTWLILGVTGLEKAEDGIGPEDFFKFRNIVLIVVAVGFVSSLIFHLGLEENANTKNANKNDPSRTIMRWNDWFTKRSFYQVALVYMFSRLFINLVQIYLPLYMQDTLNLPEISIAIFPLVMHATGLIAAEPIRVMNRRYGRRPSYSFGAILGIGACVWTYIGTGDCYVQFELYVICAMLGIACSALLITSLSVTTDLVGYHTESNAFVVGAMSFTDKLSNGFTVIAIQHLHPCQTESCIDDTNYFQIIICFVCGGVAVLALISAWSLRLPTMETEQESDTRQPLIVATSHDPLLE